MRPAETAFWPLQTRISSPKPLYPVTHNRSLILFRRCLAWRRRLSAGSFYVSPGVVHAAEGDDVLGYWNQIFSYQGHGACDPNREGQRRLEERAVGAKDLQGPSGMPR